MENPDTVDSEITGLAKINHIMLKMSTFDQAIVVEYLSERYPQFDYERKTDHAPLKWTADTPLIDRFGGVKKSHRR